MGTPIIKKKLRNVEYNVPDRGRTIVAATWCCPLCVYKDNRPASGHNAPVPIALSVDFRLRE